ncbi:MAG: two-component regulator propeller domain-containing protein [Bacteroidota bacterium]
MLKRNTLTAFDALRLLFITVCVVSCFTFKAQAQKYSFTHYDIEHGLVQSQVNGLSQDKSHRLWIGTLGGACLFDGKDFIPFTRENGLSNNLIYALLSDQKNRVWFGTNQGLSCLDGKRVTNFKVPANVKRPFITNIVEDKAGTIWFTMQSRLYKVKGNAIEQVSVTNYDEYSVTGVAINRLGNICVSVYQAGIFSLMASSWVNLIPIPAEHKNIVIRRMLFDRLDPAKVYLIADNQLFVSINKTITLYPDKELRTAKVAMLAVEQDKNGDIWVGTTNGAFYIKNNRLIHFDARNGFTDITISNIYCDHDGNLWLSTWGGGIYKYEGDSFVVFDQSYGITSFQTIMSITSDKDKNIWLATDGSGALKYNGKEFKSVPLPATGGYVKKAQCIYTDKDNNIWIGTSLGGVWKFDGNKYIMIPRSNMRIANAISQDGNGTIWMAAPTGCFYLGHDTLVHINELNGFATSLLPMGKDSMLVGTQAGVRLLVNKKLVPGFNIKALASSNIFCMITYRNKIVFGTADWGLFIWDKTTGSIKNYDVKKGLNSNSIYSLIADKHGVIWAGTGRGANRIVPAANGTDFTVVGYDSSKGIIAEANQNAAIFLDNKIWMGTTKGLIVYNTAKTINAPSTPHVIIQSVKLFTKQATRLITDAIDPQIPYNQNHLAISFLGVYLKNPGDVLYQYRLYGYDDRFSALVKNNMVDYPSLPPGKYTFQVKAVTSAGLLSKNVALYTFEIAAPFYQTWVFRSLLLLSFVLLGFGIQTYMHKRKLHSQQLIEQMKREEKQKIRQQTAEDFHDDLGNKLTRITVLSDILTAKLGEEKTEQKNLIGQIKQNAEELYNGTKDILWALDPKSDNLYEILTHIRLFGSEFFHDTSVKFNMDEINPDLNRIKLPMAYCRNITMIYKELLNNTLKHSGASRVNLSWNFISATEMKITLADNGKGFNINNDTTGHGINNIRNRAARLGGTVEVKSNSSHGTQVILKLKLKKD